MASKMSDLPRHAGPVLPVITHANGDAFSDSVETPRQKPCEKVEEIPLRHQSDIGLPAAKPLEHTELSKVRSEPSVSKATRLILVCS